MVSIGLALVASMLYGTADFLGGFGSRRVGTFAVSCLSQLSGGVVILLIAVAAGARDVTTPDVLWGTAAGVTGIGGLLLLYHGLARGPMSVVAPVTALCSLALPVVVGLGLGERPSVLALSGAALAAVAVLLISHQRLPGGPLLRLDHGVGRAVTTALASGVLIALFLVCFQRTSSDAGYWPLVVARVTSFAAVLLVVAARRDPVASRLRAAPRGTLALVATAGAIDNVANACYTTAARAHYLSVIAPVASLYPAATVLLARYVLREELRRVQVVGLLAALVAIVLITS